MLKTLQQNSHAHGTVQNRGQGLSESLLSRSSVWAVADISSWY